MRPKEVYIVFGKIVLMILEEIKLVL